MITKLSRIIESVIDPSQESLSKYVFKGGKLLPSVRFKILRNWGQINKIGPTSSVLIVGSIGTLNYSKESDIDVTIKWLGTSEEIKIAKKFTQSINGKEFAGPHEINYFIRPDIQPDHYDAIYDVITDKWLKGPSEISIDINRYMQKFEEIVSTITADKAELLDDLADYHALKHASDNDYEKAKKLAEKKLLEIETDVNKLGDEYLEIKLARNSAFSKTDLDQLKSYGHRNALPENVVYLLLRRYCYLHFLDTIYKVSDNGVEKSEIDDIDDAKEDFNTCRSAKGFEESLTISLCSTD